MVNYWVWVCVYLNKLTITYRYERIRLELLRENPIDHIRERITDKICLAFF